MARKLRSIVPGLPVHVVQRGANRCDIFVTDQDRLSYLDFLVDASEKHDCPIHCYVLMGNHVHLMMTPPDKAALKSTMHALNTRYVWHFNKRHERTGPLWEGRYRSSVIDTDAYLHACYMYIELNPVRARLCKQPQDYRWSSHRYHACGEFDRVVIAHTYYQTLDKDPAGRQRRYREIFRQHLTDEQIEQIRSGV